MAIDPSIITSGLQLPDANAKLAQYASAQNALNQNKLFQQQNANRLGVQAAYQGATDPTTGQIDPAKFQQAILSNPDTAMFAPDNLQANQGTQSNQIGLTSGNQKLVQQQLSGASQFLAPILAKSPTEVGAGDVYSAIGAAHAAGINTDPMTNDVAESMPHADPAKMNEPGYRASYGKQLQDWTRGQISAQLPAGAQLSEYTAQPTAVSTGGTTQFLDTNAVTNPNAASQAVQNTLSPDATIAQVQGPLNPDGSRTVMSQGQWAASQGHGSLVNPFGSGRYSVPPALRNPNGPVGGAPNQPAAPQAGQADDPAVFPTGAPASAQAPAQQTSGAPAQQANMPAPGPMAVSQAPGMAEAQADIAKNAASQSIDLSTQAQGSPQRLAQLEDLKSMVAQFPSGPASHLTGDIRGRLVQFAQMAGLPMSASMMDQSTAQDVFSKVSTQYASKVAEQLGGGVTNDKLFTSQQSSPNALYTRGGNQMNIAQLQGNEDALQVKSNAWQQAQQNGTPPTGYTNWSLNFNKQFAPSVFWYARMDPSQRSKFIGGMGADEKQQLYTNSMQAVQSGWVSPGQLGLAPQANQ